MIEARLLFAIDEAVQSCLRYRRWTLLESVDVLGALMHRGWSAESLDRAHEVLLADDWVDGLDGFVMTRIEHAGRAARQAHVIPGGLPGLGKRA